MIGGNESVSESFVSIHRIFKSMVRVHERKSVGEGDGESDLKITLRSCAIVYKFNIYLARCCRLTYDELHSIAEHNCVDVIFLSFRFVLQV